MQDFNAASAQRSFDLIPAGTVVDVHMTLRPGGAGDDGWLKRSKDGRSEALDAELTVIDGEYAHRKLWSLMTVKGETQGHADAATITGARVRAILESARGIRPDDMSDEATKGRCIPDFGGLDGLRFVAKIGIEKPRNGDEGRYQPKNCLLEVITPDRAAWHQILQVTQATQAKSPKPAAAAKPGTAAPAVAAIDKPVWAK